MATGGASATSRGGVGVGVGVEGGVMRDSGRGGGDRYGSSGGVDLNLIVKHSGLDRALAAVASDLALPAATAAAEAAATSQVLDALLNRFEYLVRVSLTEQRTM